MIDDTPRPPIPAGYGRVSDGPIWPDDLVWSWTTKEFLRADDPGWMRPTDFDAEFATLVVRRPRAMLDGFDRVRTYTIRRADADGHEERRDVTEPAGTVQKSLF